MLMTASDSTALATRTIHGSTFEDGHGSPHPPTYTTTTFGFRDTASLLDVVEGRTPGALYTRYGLNPTIIALEETLASIEGAETAWAFCSGMAAETALFVAHGREGVVCLGDAYGGTLDLLSSQLPQLGIPTTLLLGDELNQLDGILEAGARLVFFETPTNPTLEIFDITAIAQAAHRHGALVAVDNTFASPVNQNPLALGADVVVHSATKYLGGHSDLTAGALMGNSEVLAPIWPWRKNFGSMLAPETAALLARSLRTLVPRVRQQNESALRIAETLQTHPRVARVLYPGLADFPQHELAARMMRSFGGMLTVELNGDMTETSAVADALKLFTLAPSLGGVESLATQPVTTTHHGVSRVERTRRGISDSMIRLSVGLEDPDDLIADLVGALEAQARESFVHATLQG